MTILVRLLMEKQGTYTGEVDAPHLLYLLASIEAKNCTLVLVQLMCASAVLGIIP